MMIDQGLEALNWLLKIQTNSTTDYLSLVGNEGWYPKGEESAQYDQQPADVLCIMDACYQAYQATKKKFWKQEIDKAFSWFLGKNDKNKCLYDFSTGGCFDGLERGGVNLNQGAESTLSWLAALHLMHQISDKGIIVPIETDLESVAIDNKE